MPAPTINDWNAFGSLNNSNKADILYEYLYLNKTMAEVGEDIFGEPDGRRVSCITRCYGLEGRNGGKFRNWTLERSDFMAFVKSYPNGCNYDNGKTITEFMNQRRMAYQKRHQEEQERVRQERARQEKERQERARREREKQERERKERERQEKERRKWQEEQERLRLERERQAQENQLLQDQLQQMMKSSYNYEPKNIQEIDYSNFAFDESSYGGNNSYSKSGYESDNEDTIAVIQLFVPFLVALLIRWSINGTLFNNWFRGGITIFVALVVIVDFVYLLQGMQDAYGTVSKVGAIVFTILAIAFATYTVCAYPGNWIKRIVVALISCLFRIVGMSALDH